MRHFAARQRAGSPQAHRDTTAVEEGHSTNAHRPNVLVLLASHNGSRWIKEQLHSILAQEGVAIRIVIRDDRSSDTTLEEITHFQTDGRVQSLTGSEPSGSAAQNFFRLMQETPADGFEFIAFSDQDDIWHHDKLARACLALRSTNAAGYSSATTVRWHNGREQLNPLSGKQNPSDFLFEGAGQGCTFVLTSALYNRIRSFLSENGAQAEGIHFHDWTVYALARTWGGRWHFDQCPSMIYRQHSDNDTGARGTANGALKRWTLIRRGWYREQIEKICQLCHCADPGNARVAALHSALLRPRGWCRTMKLIQSCALGGRRRIRDNAILIFACLAGWI